MTCEQHPFVGRGGLKLQHALTTFAFDVSGMTCADLGCNIGGFTDCLLINGANKVFAVDTGYGALAWKLRTDPRVVVMERTNALHADAAETVDLVVIDLGWTPQAKAIPAARAWLAPQGHVITLIKPHYETAPQEKDQLTEGVLQAADAERITQRVLVQMHELGMRVIASERSPIKGGKGKKNREGNVEWLALLAPIREGDE